MLNTACRYNPQEHEILHCELENWLRRNVSPEWKDRFFVYRHRIHNTFVIGLWTYENDGGRYFHDVLNLGETLLSFTRKDAAQLKDLFQDPIKSRTEACRILREGQSQMMRDLQAQEAEKADRWFGRRKTAVHF